MNFESSIMQANNYRKLAKRIKRFRVYKKLVDCLAMVTSVYFLMSTISLEVVVNGEEVVNLTPINVWIGLISVVLLIIIGVFIEIKKEEMEDKKASFFPPLTITKK